MPEVGSAADPFFMESAAVSLIMVMTVTAQQDLLLKLPVWVCPAASPAFLHS